MTVALSPEQAAAVINKIHGLIGDIGERQHSMDQTVTEMTQSSWLGGKAVQFSSLMNDHDSTMTAIRNELTHLLEQASTARQHIEHQA